MFGWSRLRDMLFGRREEPAPADPEPAILPLPPSAVHTPELEPFEPCGGGAPFGVAPLDPPPLTPFAAKWRRRDALRKFAEAMRAGRTGDAVSGDGEGI